MNLDPDTQPTGGPVLGPPPSRAGDLRLAIFLFVGVLDLVFILVAILVLSSAQTGLNQQIPVELVTGDASPDRPAFVLPVVEGADPLAPGPGDIVVSLSADGRLFAGGRMTTLDSLKERLIRLGDADTSVAVLIRADGDAPTQHVMELLAACRDAGIVRVGFVLQSNADGDMAAGER